MGSGLTKLTAKYAKPVPALPGPPLAKVSSLPSPPLAEDESVDMKSLRRLAQQEQERLQRARQEQQRLVAALHQDIFNLQALAVKLQKRKHHWTALVSAAQQDLYMNPGLNTTVVNSTPLPYRQLAFRPSCSDSIDNYSMVTETQGVNTNAPWSKVPPLLL